MIQHKGPKIVLGFTSLVAMGAVYWSHYSQIQDKATMKEGVVRDKERVRMKKRMWKKREKEERIKMQNSTEEEVADEMN
jgi:activator of 2-hydroxyglutaryl-CoA dehydratase